MKRQDTPTRSSPTESPKGEEKDGTGARKHWPAARASYLTDNFRDSARNVIILALCVWAVNLLFDKWRSTGRAIDLRLLWWLISDVWIAVAINIAAFVFTVSFFLLVRLVALGVFRGFDSLVYTIYSVLQLVLLTAPVALLYAVDPGWRPVAGASVTMQGAVFAMKLHSYFFTNRHIHELLHGRQKHDRDIGDLTRLGLATAKKENPDAVFRELVSLKGFLQFAWFPTLCYYLEYPRSKAIRWRWVGIHLLQFVAAGSFAYITLEHYIPIWHSILQDPLRAFIKSLFPGFVLWMCAFYAIFHAFLNLVAEVTRFEDRRFYGAWWEARNFEEWWREWNMTVTDWMRRHVYFQAKHDAGFPGILASISVFVLSGLWHEYVIIVTLRSVLPPFISFLIVCQTVFVSVTNLKIFSETPLGNLIIWASFIIGYPLVIYSYAACWCIWHPTACPVIF